MNESLFLHGTFDSAQPLVEPDFAVLMTLARLRQEQSATVRAAAANGWDNADGDDYRLALFAGWDDARRAEGHGSGRFYDLGDFAATAGWPLATDEGGINLEVSTNIQSLPLDDNSGR